MLGILFPIGVYAVIALIVAGFALMGVRDGVKVSGIRLGTTIFDLILAMICTPIAYDGIQSIEGIEIEIVNAVIAHADVCKSAILLFAFLVAFGITSLVCEIVRHCLVYKNKKKSLNGAKERKVRGINRKAERAVDKEAAKAERVETREVKKAYNKSFRWYQRAIGGVMSTLVGIAVAFAISVPTNYVVKNLKDENLSNFYAITPMGFLEKEFEFMDYVIQEKEIEFDFDSIFGAKDEDEDKEDEETPEVEDVDNNEEVVDTPETNVENETPEVTETPEVEQEESEEVEEANE